MITALPSLGSFGSISDAELFLEIGQLGFRRGQVRAQHLSVGFRRVDEELAGCLPRRQTRSR